jgi:hypothetical protein
MRVIAVSVCPIPTVQKKAGHSHVFGKRRDGMAGPFLSGVFGHIRLRSGMNTVPRQKIEARCITVFETGFSCL